MNDPTREWELVPFERVGPVRLGASREEVASVLGRPDREVGPAQFFGAEGPVRVTYDGAGQVLAVEVGPERPVELRGRGPGGGDRAAHVLARVGRAPGLVHFGRDAELTELP